MYACMGDGDRSLASLEKLWSQFLKPNTMYKESGPVIETPLAAAQTLNEMLLQSWGERVRVFPAMPSHWKDACFVQLAAEGGFRVSAARKDGATRWIEVTSLAGEPLLLQTDLKGLRVLDNPHVTVEELPQPEGKPVHLYRIHGLGAGESVAFAGAEAPVEALEAFAADFTANPEYRYGLQDATEYNRAALSFDL